MWTDPKRPKKVQVDMFAKHPVVRRVPTDGLARRVVE